MKTCRIWILELPTLEVENSKIMLCVTSTSEMTAISRSKSNGSQISRHFSLAPYHPCHQTLRCTRTAVAPQKHPGSQNMAKSHLSKLGNVPFGLQLSGLTSLKKYKYVYIYIDTFKNRNINIIRNHHLPKFQGYQPMWLCKSQPDPTPR